MNKALTFAAVFFMVACAPRRIPGTEIDDTSETRALIAVMQQYRSAIEAKDPDAVMALIDPNFKDNAGTATPADDVDYKVLRQALVDRFAKVDALKLDFEVKKIEVEDDTANAVYSYTSSFRLPGLTPKAMGDSELEQMTFHRSGSKWLITSGI
jgi:hypothetical protein